MNEGALLTVRLWVLSNDVKGADGATIDGVRAAGGDTTTAVSGGVGTDIRPARHAASECRRQLHLPVDGEQHHGGHHRRVRLTVKDGDGDLSTTTLTINLANATVLAPADNDVTVNENALDTTVTAPDLAAGTVTGSLRVRRRRRMRPTSSTVPAGSAR